jgi:amidase
MWPVLGAVISDDTRRFLDGMLTLVPPLDQAAYAAAFMTRQELARAWTEFQADAPLVLGPVATQPPFTIGTDLGGPDAADTLREMLDLTVLCNCLGLPAVALPAGIEAGLPVGVQIIGPRYREDLCLTAAWEVERALGAITPIDPRS